MTAGKDHQLVTNTMQIEDLPCLQNSSLQRTCVDNTRTWHGPEVVVIHDVIGKHEYLFVPLFGTDVYAGAATQQTDAVFAAKIMLSKIQCNKDHKVGTKLKHCM